MADLTIEVYVVYFPKFIGMLIKQIDMQHLAKEISIHVNTSFKVRDGSASSASLLAEAEITS